jgi:hypothetical protein
MQFNVYRVISKGDRTRAYPTAIAPGHFCLAGLRGSGTSFGFCGGGRRRVKKPWSGQVEEPIIGLLSAKISEYLIGRWETVEGN